MKAPRVVISATSSDSGKTLISAAILRIMKNKNLKPQPFKAGPDYIDPMYLSRASGRPCRNLDSWIMDEETLLYSFVTGSMGADLAVIEGVRGLYEGESPVADIGSTAHIAKILSAPIVLVLDCKSLTRSAAAQILGYQSMDREVKIGGVILNNVRDVTHEEKLRVAIKHYTNVPILGVLYRSPELYIKKRHLGLLTPHELSNIDKIIGKAAMLLETSLDIDKLLDLMMECPEIDDHNNKDLLSNERRLNDKKIKIGVFVDFPFSFYYNENLFLLKDLGAEICIIDSLVTREIESGIAGVLIGGGYPEVFAGELEKNQPLKLCLYKKIVDEMPVFVECGGLLYLCESINYNGKRYKMVGVFDGEVYFSDKPKALSYVKLEAVAESPISDVGRILKGHEFHYSYVENLSCEFAFKVIRGRGIKDGMDGAMAHNTIGTYTHMHYLANPSVPVKFISACSKYINK